MPPSLTLALACLFAAIFTLALLASSVLSRSSRVERIARNVDRYGPRHAALPADGLIGKVAQRWVAPLLRFRDTQTRLAQRLDLAGIARDPAEWTLLGGLGGLVVAVMLTAVTRSPLVAAVLAAVAAWLGMRLALNVRIARRRAAFSDQLPDVLQFIAGSLYAGFSLAQGLDALVREGQEPTASEFSRALAQSQIGVPLEAALDTVADRMDSGDLRWTVIAIRTQREVGGNLAEVLGHTVDTMRDRSSIRRHVRALSAEGRLSAYVLIAMPILVGGWLFLASRSYVRPLYTTGPGIGMLTVAVLLMVVGSVWMRKMVRVDV